MLKTTPGMARDGASFEASLPQSLHTRRMRPNELTRPEDRTPLRQEKSNRRESRLGLRNLFNRSKSSSIGEYDRPASPTRTASARKLSARTAAPELDGRSVESLPPQPQDQPSLGPRLSLVVDRSSSQRPPDHFELPTNETSNATPRPARHVRNNSDVTLQQPPLFKAYPQAIRNATLSAPTLTADAILRLNENKRGFVYGADSSASVDTLQDSSRDGEKERPRRLQRHVQSLSSSSTPRFEWTNRIYILSTSGCLLEYAGTGSFDRLPEKVVRLSKTSAAYVSDAIPGRHYVLQISSGAEQDIVPTDESRSLLSKFVPRGSDRRNATNMLMTFDNVEEMNGWMVSLRREIERLGGQRPLSETGEPKRESENYQPEEEQTQRLLVLKNHSPFTESFDWPSVRDGEGPDGTLMVRDPSLDDGSTNSVVSQDGRQLDNLRESGNRLSHVSSGQRTMVSSGSSPMSSPTRDCFPSPCEEPPLNYEVRSRPNAAAILNRRKSLQVTTPFIEPVMRQIHTSHSAAPRAVPAIPGPIPMQTPNFSVPRSANRHFAPTASPPSTKHEPSPIYDRDAARPQRPRKPPPMALHSARPLSMVIDQPSPQTENAVLPATHALARPQSSRGAEGAPSPYRSASTSRPLGPVAADRWQLGPPNRFTTQPAPRRMSSMNSMRKAGGGSYTVRASLVPLTQRHGALEEHRPAQAARALQRVSMHAMAPQGLSRLDAMDEPLATGNVLPPLLAPPPSVPLPPLPAPTKNSSQLTTDAKSKALMYRRSMPQLAYGPPAPPPMSALPPLPPKPSIQIGGFI